MHLLHNQFQAAARIDQEATVMASVEWELVTGTEMAHCMSVEMVHI